MQYPLLTPSQKTDTLPMCRQNNTLYLLRNRTLFAGKCGDARFNKVFSLEPYVEDGFTPIQILVTRDNRLLVQGRKKILPLQSMKQPYQPARKGRLPAFLPESPHFATKKRKRRRHMRKFLQEFKEFAMRGNVMDLAVGVIIGAAFQTIINSLVNDIIMPLIGLIGKVDFSQKVFVLGA